MSATRPETCPACVSDPKAAPGRYCAAKSCRCAHPACPAAASYRPVERPFAYVTLLHPNRDQEKTA